MKERVGRLAPYTVALLALASSAVGITNWFTYDDRYIVELNPIMNDLAHWWRSFTQSYWPRDWGGDGYRPITILAFKIETWIGHGIPVPFHAVNILLYLVVSVLVFFLARRLLPQWAAWLTAALFAVHPVHVEAVANIVGQSELLVAVAVLSATLLYLRDRQQGPLRTRTAFGIGAVYLLGCMSKEHGIVLPAILAAAELTVLDDGRAIRERLRDTRLRTFFLGLALVAVCFVAVRAVVLSDHGIGGFQPFTPFNSLKVGSFDRVLTALGVVPEWVRLFLWPAHLASEYGPPDIQIAQGVALWQLPGFLLLVATLALAVLLRRRQPVISFGIVFLCAALLPSSNFLVPAGIVLAERTLFLPSVGAMLVVGGTAVVVMQRIAARYRDRESLERILLAGVVVLLSAGVWRSESRTQVWKDNETLFHQAVIDAPLSYRAHYMLGAWSFEKSRKRFGEAEYRRALTLFPYDPFLSYNTAEQYRKVGMCAQAVPFYRWTRGLDPNFPLGRAGYSQCLLEIGQYDEAKKVAYEAMSVGGELKQARRLVFLADSAKAAEARVGLAGGPKGTPSKVP